MVTSKSNKPSKIARFVVYPLLAVLFVLLASFVLALANGYWPTMNNGRIIFVRTGMLIVASRPSGGKIYLNNKDTKSTTGFYLFANKFSSLLPSTINVEIKKQGYRTWQKYVDIFPGVVSWANYVLLFPEKLAIEKVTPPSGNLLSKSVDGRQLLFFEGGSSMKVTSYDSENFSARSFWPSNTADLPVWLKAPQITSASYNQSNDRVLYTIKNGDITEFVVTENNNNDIKLIILNEQLASNPSEVSFSTVDSNQLYATKDSNLYLLTSTSKSLGSSLVKNLISYSVQNNRLIYYVSRNDQGLLLLEHMNLDGSNKQTISQSIATSGSYRFAHTPDQDILALLNVDTKDLYLYYPGNGGKMTTLGLASGIVGMTWSRNNQKLLYYGKNSIYRYDSEKKKETFSSTTEEITSAVWFFDDCHFLISDKQSLYVIDYDGTNKVPVSAAPISSYAIDSSNANIVFGIQNHTVIDYTKYLAQF